MENQITPASAAKAPATLDAHGFDPNDYDWIPVLRKRRADGWSPERQRGFIEALADCGSVAQAAREVGMSETSAYKLRRSPGAEGFDRAWSAAIDAASKKLIDSAFERALVGTDEPVFDRDGRRVGRRLRQSDKLLMFLLRAYMPDRFRHPVNDRMAVGEPPAPALAPVAEALARMVPELPPEPHMLMEPEDLEAAIEVADLLDGELPHYHRDAKPQTYVPSAMEQALDRKLDEIRRRDATDEGEYYDDDDEGAMG